MAYVSDWADVKSQERLCPTSLFSHLLSLPLALSIALSISLPPLSLSLLFYQVTGQAFEDMQDQNLRLLQQLREKDDANFKLMSERIKSNQVK